MATKTSQRVGIWIIAGVMLFGTLGAFFLPILANDSASNDAELKQQTQNEIAKEQEACPSTDTAPVQKITPVPIPPQAPVVEDIPELKTVDITVGDGAEVKAGDCIELLFHGTLAKDGKAFEGGDNYADGTPYRALTTGFVPGFAEGLVGVKVGGERQILIPSDKAYGAQPPEGIPANADLVFAVRVVNIYKAQ